eukprot:symbB.v1.2.041999.t1/scaffold9004.1/size4438/1
MEQPEVSFLSPPAVIAAALRIAASRHTFRLQLG